MIIVPSCITRVRSETVGVIKIVKFYIHISLQLISFISNFLGDSFSTNGDLTMITKDPDYQVR